MTYLLIMIVILILILFSPFFFSMVRLPFTKLPTTVTQKQWECCWHPMLTSTNKTRLVGCYDFRYLISFDDIFIDNDCYSHSHFVFSPFFFSMVTLPFTKLPIWVTQKQWECCWHSMLTSTNKIRLVVCYDFRYLISFDDIFIDNDCYSHSHFVFSPFSLVWLDSSSCCFLLW